MRILLANKFYYHRGGDCIYTIELEKLLKSKGHQVAIFSMFHPANKNSEYSEYFPSQVDFNKRDIRSIVSLLIRPFGSHEVREKFNRILTDFRPDIIHLNNIHSQLSPIIAQMGHNRGIPIVWTLHDYKLVCPAYLLLSKGKPCQLCLEKKWSVISEKCIKDNFIASFIAYWEASYWNSTKLCKITDLFISPSNFLRGKMIQGGFDPGKIVVLNNFMKSASITAEVNTKEDYYCYIGRLSSEKGIETLLKAASGLPGYKLKIVGTGQLEKAIHAFKENANIEFVGFKSGDELNSILSGSRFLVIPSIWYENNPLSVLEALCMGIPVLGSDIGGIPELIIPDFNGMLFEAGNVTDLQDKIKYLWRNNAKFTRTMIAENAAKSFRSDAYYEKIIGIYDSLFEKKDRLE